MSRESVKYISRVPSDFIPKSHEEYKVDAPEMKDRPMIFVGVSPNRDQSWAIQEMFELKDSKKPEKGVRGMGEAYKYMWENIISEVKNVITDKEELVSVTGEDKNKLWYAEGMESEITEAITHFYTNGKLDDNEVKTSV
jgi:hypothetical protein